MHDNFARFDSSINSALYKVIAKHNPLSFDTFLNECRVRGIAPSVTGDTVIVEQALLTDDLRLAFVTHRAQLIQHLTGRVTTPQPIQQPLFAA